MHYDASRFAAEITLVNPGDTNLTTSFVGRRLFVLPDYKGNGGKITRTWAITDQGGVRNWRRSKKQKDFVRRTGNKQADRRIFLRAIVSLTTSKHRGYKEGSCFC